MVKTEESLTCKKKMIGASIGLAVIFYMMDLLCRVIPAFENAKYITPFYYSNASDIFSGEMAGNAMYIIGLGITTFKMQIVTFKPIVFEEQLISAANSSLECRICSTYERPSNQKAELLLTNIKF